MKLNQLKIAVTSAKDATKLAHWLVKGPNFYVVHKLLDEVYEFLAEAEDRIAESAVAHGELVNTTSVVKTPDNYISPEEAIHIVTQYLKECLAALSVLERYDLGVDNMVGDLYEKLYWWDEYILSKGVV